MDMKSGNISDAGQDSLSSLLSKDDGSSESMDAVTFKNIKADGFNVSTRIWYRIWRIFTKTLQKMLWITFILVALTYGASETIKCFLIAAKKEIETTL